MDKFINNRSFKSLNEFPGQIYQVEKIKTFLSSCTPNLQCCNFDYKFCSYFYNPNRYELIDTDTDSFYMAISEEKLDEISRPERRLLWCWMMQSDCSDNFAANSNSNLSHENVIINKPYKKCNKPAAFDKRLPGVFEEDFWQKIFRYRYSYKLLVIILMFWKKILLYCTIFKEVIFNKVF